MKHLVDKTILVPFREELKYAVCIVSGRRFPAFRQGKHRVRLYAGHSSGQKPGPTLDGQGPKDREKKCMFTLCRDYDAVDKENDRPTEGRENRPCLPL